MYYYPRVPKSFSPSPFTNKLYDNSTIQRVFHPSTTPQPLSPINKRKRSFSMVQKTNNRSRSTTKQFQQNSVEKVRSKNDNIKLIKPSSTGKVTIHYINNGSNRPNSSATHKTFQMNLDDYFEKVYFTKIAGFNNKELYEKLEPYIKEIVLLDEQNSQIQDNWIPSQYQGINTKQKLLSSIKKLEKINRKEFIKELIMYYCIPSQKIRTTILLGLIADIHLKIREKSFLDYSFTSYCLMTNKGKVVTDILKLPLLSSEIIFCEKNTNRQSYVRFKEMKNKSQVDGYQNNLLDIIKNTFRDRVKNIDQQFKPEKIQKFQKKIFKQTISIVSRRKKLPPEYKHMKTKRNDKSINLVKLKEEYGLSAKEALGFIDEFQNLICTNNRYPESQKYPIQLKSVEVLLNNFKQNCISLEGKQKENVNNILQCMQFVQTETIDLKKYVEFRLIVECLADSAVVVKFLMKFIKLDTEKQLTKQMLMESFRLTLSQYKIPRSNKVIIDILWLEFKRINLIQYVEDKEYLTINRFKENYLGNKTVYYLIMTIIFCTKDPVDTAFEVLN